MAGGDFVFNVSLGEVKKYAKLDGGANDGLVLILFKLTSLEADATLRDHDTIAALIAATGNDECDFTNYTRKVLTGIDAGGGTVDDANERVRIAFTTPVTYTAAGGATNNTVGKAVIAYDNDTTVTNDALLIPLTAHDVDFTTDGNDIDLNLASAYFYQAS